MNTHFALTSSPFNVNAADASRFILLFHQFTHVHVFGPDIYVTRNPVLNAVARMLAALLDRIYSLLFKFYGRTETTIFRKNIIAVAYAPAA